MDSTVIEHEQTPARRVEEILTSEQLTAVRHATEDSREHGLYVKKDSTPSFLTELRETSGVGNGDYEEEIYIREYEPADLSLEIQNYTEELLQRGVTRVNIVDFGAGGAKTLCRAGESMQTLVNEGKVRFVATNLYATPTPEFLDLVDDYLELHRELSGVNPEQVELLRRTLKNNTVNFLRADVLDLFEYMQDEPIHLLFMSHTFSPASHINDAILSLASEMVDHQNGSLVLGLENLGTSWYGKTLDERGGKTVRQLMDEGLEAVKEAGFESKVEVSDRRHQLGSFVVYQASNAPPFKLVDRTRHLSAQEMESKLEEVRKSAGQAQETPTTSTKSPTSWWKSVRSRLLK